jgi:hypothetical protein
MGQTCVWEKAYPPPKSPPIITPANPRTSSIRCRAPTVKGLDRVAALRALDGWGSAAQHQLCGLAGGGGIDGVHMAGRGFFIEVLWLAIG